MGALAYCLWYWFGEPSPNRTSEDWPIQPTPIRFETNPFGTIYRSYPFEMTSLFERTFAVDFYTLVTPKSEAV
jgi:hypothetical protein